MNHLITVQSLYEPTVWSREKSRCYIVAKFQQYAR